jgi:hypothetical protein
MEGSYAPISRTFGMFSQVHNRQVNADSEPFQRDTAKVTISRPAVFRKLSAKK